jgi:hypothetical protein
VSDAYPYRWAWGTVVKRNGAGDPITTRTFGRDRKGERCRVLAQSRRRTWTDSEGHEFSKDLHLAANTAAER